MSPAAVVLVMPVATVALPPNAGPRGFVPLQFSTSSPPGRGDVAAAGSASDASYPVPSLPLHHARSCFRVYQRARASPRPASPVSASDNEVSDLLRDCVNVDIQLHDLLHRQRQRHHRYHHRLLHRECCDSITSDAALPWQCSVPSLRDDVSDDDELVEQSRDVMSAVRTAAPPSVINAAAFYRPSLDFNKMQVSICLHIPIYSFITSAEEGSYDVRAWGTGL